jgi:FK506-binding protein 14
MKITPLALSVLALSTGFVLAKEKRGGGAGSKEKKKSAGRLHIDRYSGPKSCDDDDKAVAGKHLKMHYIGTIHASSKSGEKGKQFDSSRERGETFDFQIGTGQVIKGWDIGLLNLCKGAKAKIIIPPEMAYGEQGAGEDIPGGATLHFDIEVIDVTDEAPPGPDLFKEIDTDEDGKLTKEEVEAFFQEKHGNGMPDGLWENEDKNQDGHISWEEFGGTKGDPPGAEL